MGHHGGGRLAAVLDAHGVNAPPEAVGSLLTLVNSIGFAISIVSIELFVALAEHAAGAVLPWLALGPLLGVLALRPLLGFGR